MAVGSPSLILATASANHAKFRVAGVRTALNPANRPLPAETIYYLLEIGVERVFI